ncbi:efflux RND transporter periplasmic adaptor subunit [Pseudomaricurvus sp. HS19]|uniref:efflux RND transporter periplasmic adaptor subunit n=1 Tax=Pseudomaricurvus sp. HS19 TaxID=2692626 RepID=UPI00136C6F48|nr:efflux RND transporter periplasmic adaptor subunit [Pseudomaricurvus sp. HS19]MYM65178.1 efflux RND transporter periplasmic adaptor subunit [Pseudomaricurvus sp. HS19]
MNKWIGWLVTATALWSAAAVAQEVEYLPAVGCIIEPSVRVAVSSPVEGVLEKRPLRLGDAVKKGDPLFSLRSDVEQASVELARIRSEFALRHYQRNEDMYQEELISIHERDEFQTEYQVAVKEYQQAQAILALRSVKSPINGVVVDYFAEAGEFVTSEPVMVVATLDPLKVEVVMPYSSVGSVPDKAQLMVYPSAPVGGAYPAKVTLIDPIIDAASGTYRIRANIPNPRRQLPAGIECRVALSS